MSYAANDPLAELINILQEKFGERMTDFLLPPPVFLAMQGELLEIDVKNATLRARFPILESYRNPYGTMQGGMIAAAVDNTLGPLSVAMAPPNVTRTLEMKYSQAVRPEMGYIVVEGRLVERADPKLVFEARVTSPDGQKLATCRATHWIVDATRRG
jgi:acyl-coenzyme A thioesterase PaaI-like protein